MIPYGNPRMRTMLTQADRENYGDEFLDLTRRAAVDAVGPQLNQLRQENAHLRQMAQRSQRADIERALDNSGIDWHAVYNDPRFSQWLSEQDPYNDGTRSQHLRRAVAAGDSNRVVRFYAGFLQEAGHHAPAGQRSHQSRSPATSGNIYTRQQITDLYKRRRLGQISDSRWAQIEPDIVKAAAQGRVAGAINPVDGTEMTRLAR
jgi:hypothetical protein